MLEQYFAQTIIKIPVKRNAYADWVIDPNGNQVKLRGRFRINPPSKPRYHGAYEEEKQVDAIAWFKPTESLKVNDILLAENLYWEVIKINYPRKLGSNKIEFLKVSCMLHATVS